MTRFPCFRPRFPVVEGVAKNLAATREADGGSFFSKGEVSATVSLDDLLAALTA